MQYKYGITYSPNYLVSVVSNEIPNKIAKLAKRLRLLAETPESDLKTCIHCGKKFPKDSIFFSKNKSHKDGLSSTCKACDRLDRVKKGVNSNGDLRTKDPTLPKV